jgi:hypothetical protein
MKKFIVLSKLKHEQHTENGNNEIHCQTIEANTFGEVELSVKIIWARIKCECEIIQITIAK